jgi:hypothetical protein
MGVAIFTGVIMRPLKKGRQMINVFKKREPLVPTNVHRTNEVIEDILSEIRGMTSGTEEYSNAVDQLSKMIKLQEEIQTPSDKISLDVLITAGANLLGILLILNHERMHVVTSKALGFVTKLR